MRQDRIEGTERGVTTGAGRTLSRRAALRAAGAAAGGFALAAALTACGGAATQPQAAGDAVKFISTGDNSKQTRMHGYLAGFQKSTGIGVSLVTIQNYYTSNVQAMVAAGVPPDVLYVSRPEFDSLYPDNKLADLRPSMSRDAKAADGFFPLALQEWQRSDKQLALPMGFRTQAMAYNTGLFEQNDLKTPPTNWADAGWTIPDFANAAIKTAKPGSSAQGANYGFYVDPTYPVWSAFVVNAGGTVVNEQQRTIEVDQAPAVEALTVLQNVIRTAGVMPPEDLVSADGGVDLFANGNLTMTITNPSTVNARQDQAHFTWDAGVLPGGAGGRFTTGTGAGYALLAGSKRADNGWKLIKYLTGETIQTQEAPYGQWIPSRQAVATSPAFLPELENVDLAPQHARVFVDAIANGKVKLQPPLPNWQAVLAALEAGIQGLWNGKLSPDAAAAQMKKLAEPLLKQG